jgi:hypothetical protein
MVNAAVGLTFMCGDCLKRRTQYIHTHGIGIELILKLTTHLHCSLLPPHHLWTHMALFILACAWLAALVSRGDAWKLSTPAELDAVVKDQVVVVVACECILNTLSPT